MLPKDPNTFSKKPLAGINEGRDKAPVSPSRQTQQSPKELGIGT
jgi:hypothetical protein